MRIEEYTSVTSTNQIARDDLDAWKLVSMFHPDVIVAHKQTQGKGRSGNWFSPEDCGIYMSVIRPTTISFKNRTAAGKDLTESIRLCMLDISYHITEALSNYTHLKLEQQGNNDIYLAGRKVAGVLCEYHPKHDKLIVGIGLNTFRPMKVRKDLLNKAVWLNEYASEYLLDHKTLINLIAEAVCSI